MPDPALDIKSQSAGQNETKKTDRALEGRSGLTVVERVLFRGIPLIVRGGWTGFFYLLVATTFVIGPAALFTLGYESSRLLVFGIVTEHTIVVTKKLERTPHGATTSVNARVVLHGKEEDLLIDVETFGFLGSKWEEGRQSAFVLEDPFRREYRVLGKKNTIYARISACRSGLLLLIPLGCPLGGLVLQILQLASISRHKWTTLELPADVLGRLNNTIEFIAFFTFALFALLLWFGCCAAFVFIVLDSKQSTLLQAGLPLTFLTFASLLPLVQWMCALRESRYWPLVENLVFLGLAFRVAWTVAETSMGASTFRAATIWGAVVEVAKHLLGL